MSIERNDMPAAVKVKSIEEARKMGIKVPEETEELPRDEVETCKVCNERPADHPVRRGWCRSCVGKNLAEARRNKVIKDLQLIEEIKEEAKPKPEPKSKTWGAKMEGVFRLRPASRTVPKGAEIMQHIKRIADDEFRAVNTQIFYMLHWCLKKKYGIDVNEQTNQDLEADRSLS